LFTLSEVESPSTSVAKLATCSAKDIVLVVITDMVTKLEAFLEDVSCHGKVSTS